MAATGFASRVVVENEAPGKSRVIDLVHLARQTLGDRELELEILRIFAKLTRAYLKGVVAPGSPEELKLSLHSLKGASVGVGANGLAASALAAEVELRETGEVQSESVADISMAVEEVNVFIDELLER